jgi:MOSC domain-containing protein YiiM
MKVLSIQVGLSREVKWRGRSVKTGIFKEPVADHIMLRTLNLEGNRQTDLSMHGGLTKVVYAYPSEHYEYWRNE